MASISTTLGAVMQLRRLTRSVLGVVGISDYCLFRRILWTPRALHEASAAVSLVPNPFSCKVLIKICCAAFSCGAIIAVRKALTLARAEEEEEGCAKVGKDLVG